MRLRTLGVAAAMAASAWSMQDTPARSVWDGVYTPTQAERGHRLYAAHCANCHGNDLLAQDPEQIAREEQLIARGVRIRSLALRGAVFISNWNDLTVGDLVERIRISMPQQAPGSLSRRQVVDITAFLLQQNGFATGDHDLPADPDELHRIAITVAR